MLKREGGSLPIISSSMVFPVVTLFFFVFPYIQIFPIGSYTQPYGLICAALIVLLRPHSIFDLPLLDRFMLFLLAFLGCTLLLVEVPFGIDFREISFLISYITPLISTAAAFWIIQRYPTLSRRFLIFGAIVISFVGLIQIVFLPSFLTHLFTNNSDLGWDIIASGRGALGLSPEPTHNAFHSFLLASAIALSGGPTWAITLAVVNAIFVAQSASAVLALVMGGLLWALTRPLLRFWVFLPIVFFSTSLIVVAAFFDEASRIGRIISELQEYGLGILLFDYSINSRIAGATMPVYFSFFEFFMPQGVSIQRWLEVREMLISEFDWIQDLSQTGPASGIGLFLFQGGWIAIPFLFYLGYRLVLQFGSFLLVGITSALAFSVFIGQFYFSTPMFGLVLAYSIMHMRGEKANLFTSRARDLCEVKNRRYWRTPGSKHVIYATWTHTPSHANKQFLPFCEVQSKPTI